MWFLYVLATLALLFGLGVLFLRRVWFHRNPEHEQWSDSREVRAPVYGRVAYIRKVEDGFVESEKLAEKIPISDITKEDWPEGQASGDGWLIGIAMTPLDVHFQYAPTGGSMGSIVHHAPRTNLPMFDFWEYVRITWLRRHVQLWAKRYVFENERQTMWLQTPLSKMALVLIADKFVSKISTFVRTGQTVAPGERLSFIARGSQVDLLICGQPGLEVLVSEGQSVFGPKTVLARLEEH